MSIKDYTKKIKEIFPALDIVSQITTNGEQEFLVTDLVLKLQTKAEVTDGVYNADEVVELVRSTLEGVIETAASAVNKQPVVPVKKGPGRSRPGKKG